MKKLFVVTVAAVCLTAGSALGALGPVTGSATAGALANANTITVTVPGLVGVDLESNLAWDFTAMNPAPARSACSASNNQWPISITCATSGAGTVMYDPTNSTDPAIGTAPNNAATVGAASLAALSPAGEKAIWLSLFCSKSTAGQPTLTTTMGALTPAPVGFNETNFQIKGSTTQNTGGVGGTTRQAFVAGGSTLTLTMGTLGAAGATFGWTRADQVVTMVLPYNAALGSASTSTNTSTLYFTISK